MEHAKLDNCKHCGGNHIALIRTIIDDIPYWHVECADCSIRTDDYAEIVDTDRDFNNTFDDIVEIMESAIDCATNAWNKRPESCEEDEEDDEVNDSSYSTPCWLDEMMDGLNRLCDYVHKCAESTKGAK